ncbi:MAG TPA: formate/nitrite transporter family protein, partial [Syntrophomonadaceae bacterium]|nr:formate/nitrite transporter family protein [Syntrophomonadaceae bacterium]HWP97142.1 formate/nitrite transporter family protein [Syntrophomonadaceae bacterium]
LYVSHIPAIVDAAAKSVVTAQMTPDAAAAAVATFKSAVTGEFTWSIFLIKNLIPVTLGNIVGGAIFVAGIYWYSYLKPLKK